MAKTTIDVYAGLAPVIEEVVDYSTAVPIAFFEGAVYAVPGKRTGISPLSPTPVVSIFEGTEVFYLSIETMIDTCIAWVEQPNWKQFSTAPNEQEIWKQHNPGVFECF